MKTTLRPMMQLTACGLASLTLLTAHAEKGKFYAEADAGGAVTVNTELEEWFGAAIAPNSVIELDPGFRLGLKGGYGVTDWFDAEVETGVMANKIKSITGATETDGALANFPLLLNARFHCPALHRWSPFFGGGLGFSTTILSGDNITIGGTTLDGDIGGVVFAYQAFAGLSYAINERMGVSLQYHYFATTDSDMETSVSSGTASNQARLGGTATHTATIAFNYRF